MSNTSTTTAPEASKTNTYENNPFFVATNGLDLLFKRAQSIGILLAILVGISALSSLPSAFVPSNDPGQQAPAAQGSDATGFPSIPAEVWLIIAGVVLLLVAGDVRDVQRLRVRGQRCDRQGRHTEGYRGENLAS